MRQVLSIVFGAGFTAATAWALGRVLFHRLRIRLHAGEHELLAGIAGAAALSGLIFLICSLGAAYTGTFVALGVGVLALNYRLKTGTDQPALGRPERLWLILFGAGFAVYTWVYLANAMAPDYSPDGQTYHLGLTYRFFREHGFKRLTTTYYSNIPLGMELLFLQAFSLGRQSAATLLHCLMLLSLPLLIFSYGRRIGQAEAGAGAALMVFLSPVAGWVGTNAYNDVALATATFATFYLTEIWREAPEDNATLPVAIGLVGGFCFAMKYTGFPAMLYVIVVMVWLRRWRALGLALAAGSVIAAPWLVKNWLWLGNPFSPFLNRLFPNPYVHVAFEEFMSTWFRRYDIPDLRPLLWMVTVTGRTAGQLGPWFLLAPLGLAALAWKKTRWCAVAGLIFLIPYPANIGTRFLLPALPCVALALAFVLVRWRPAMVVVMLAASVLAWPKITGKYEAPGNTRIREIPWKAARRKISQDEFMRAHSVPWISAQMLDYYVPKGKRVLSTTPVADGYCATDVMVTYHSGEGDLLQETLTTAQNADLQPTWNWRFTFPAQALSELRLVQTEASPEDNWSIGELYFFNGAAEVRPSELDATPYPFDIGLGMDRNPATRWKTWEPIRPGMHVDAFFKAGTVVDRVEMHSSHDQGRIAVHPEVCVQDVCRPIRATVERVDLAGPAEVRRSATAFLKSRGIAYLLIDDANWLAKDMQADPGRWGMTFVAERAGNRLYMLN